MSLMIALLAAAAAQPLPEAPAAPPLQNPNPAVASAPAGVTVYPPAFFAAMQPQTAYDMINRIPGFVFDSGDTARGFAGTASNVLIDGARPASKSDTADSILSRIPASDVERIELIRGGAPGIDMHGRTVMANVIRKKGDETQITVSVQDNLFLNDGHTIPGGSIIFSKRFGERTIEAQLSRYSSLDDSVGDGTITTIPSSGGQTIQNARTAGHGGGVGLMTNYKGPELGGNFSANFKLEETYFNNGLSYGLPPTLVVNDHQRGRDGELGVNYERKFGKFDLELIGLQHLERDTATETQIQTGDNAFFHQNLLSGESIGRVVLHYQAHPNLTFEGGGEAVYNFLDGNEYFTDNGAAITLPSSDVTVKETRGEVFGQMDWKITPKLKLEAGARFEYSKISEDGDAHSERSFFYPKPRLLLTWDPWTDTQVRLRFERKLGQLNFSNFVSSVDLAGAGVKGGNPELRPDDHWQYEAAIEQRFWGKGSIVITALHEQISDVSDYIPIAGTIPLIDGPGNIGSGTSDQLDIEGTFPLDRFGIPGGQFKSTTIWRTSSVTDPVTHQDRRITAQRPDQIQFEYDQDVPQWKSTFSLVWFKGWRETYYRLGEIDRFHIGDQYMQAEWDYTPMKGLKISTQIDNLLPFKFYRHRTVWDGVRNGSPVDFDDYRTITSQPRLWIKIRKTF